MFTRHLPESIRDETSGLISPKTQRNSTLNTWASFPLPVSRFSVKSPLASNIFQKAIAELLLACSLPAAYNTTNSSFCMHVLLATVRVLSCLKLPSNSFHLCMFFLKSTGKQKTAALHPHNHGLSTTYRKSHPKLQGNKSCPGVPRCPQGEPFKDLLPAL